jgi:hypothetical protein
MIFISMASPARADSICETSNLSALIGTTCDIGSLQFTFTGTSGELAVFTNTFTEETPLMPDDFTFIPLPDGFQLSGPGAKITAPVPPAGSGEVDITDDIFELRFTVADLNGAITGVSAMGGNPTASGTRGASSAVRVALFPVLPPPSGCLEAISSNVGEENLGTVSTEQTSSNPCGPIYFADGSAEPVNLSASNGDTASVDTTTQFTFMTPEPGTLTLLLCGLMLLVGFAYRAAHPASATAEVASHS